MLSKTKETQTEIKKIQDLKKRIIMYFSIIIIFFLGIVLYANKIINVADSLYRYKIDHTISRQIYLLEFNQEFTNMRRLFETSFYNPAWQENAELIDRVHYELVITNSCIKMCEFVESYIGLTSNEDEDANIMGYVLNYVDAIYSLFSENFFMAGDNSRYAGNMSNYKYAIEESLRKLNYAEVQAVAEISEYIKESLRLNKIMLYAFLAIALLATATIAYFIINDLKNYAKLVEEVETSDQQDIVVKNEEIFDEMFEELDEYYTRPEVQTMMQVDFIESQENAIVDIRSALDKGDFESASLIAHTIKSLSRYIAEEDLAKAAFKVEKTLSQKKVQEELLQAFEKEFTTVFNKLKSLHS